MANYQSQTINIISNKYFSRIKAIFFYWFCLTLILFLSSFLPHQSHPITSWMNISLYGLILLLGMELVKFDEFQRLVFILLVFAALTSVFSGLNKFMGQAYLFGSNVFTYKFYAWRKSLMTLTFTLFRVSLFFSYFHLQHRTKKIIVSFTFAIILGMAFFILGPYFIHENFMAVTHREGLYERCLPFYFISWLALSAYLLRWSITRRPHSAYIHGLVIVNWLVVTWTTLDYSSYAWYNIEHLGPDQYFLLLILLAEIVLLFLRLAAVLSPLYRTRERLLRQNGYLQHLQIYEKHSTRWAVWLKQQQGIGGFWLQIGGGILFLLVSLAAPDTLVRAKLVVLLLWIVSLWLHVRFRGARIQQVLLNRIEIEK
ncbi:hypothetical protein GF406_27095 [candidate division KSB1 bacterium]|nr:hypothetical protein [candidate division KSB1 bacterium]